MYIFICIFVVCLKGKKILKLKLKKKNLRTWGLWRTCKVFLRLRPGSMKLLSASWVSLFAFFTTCLLYHSPRFCQFSQFPGTEIIIYYCYHIVHLLFRLTNTPWFYEWTGHGWFVFERRLMPNYPILGSGNELELNDSKGC